MSHYYFYKTLFFCLSFCFATHSLAWGQIFGNPITGPNPNTADPYITGQTVDINLTVSGIGRGAGIAGVNANDRYNARDWNGITLAPNDYFEFTLTPNAGYQIDFSNFVYTGQASATGATNVAFRSSIDAFATDIGTATITGTTIDLTGAAFQNITTAITFRVYAWGATETTGTFSINDFAFNGAVILVGTPPSNPTGFFRSKQNGNWNNPGTWQASTDGMTWADATLFPTSDANTITILPTHTVNVTADVTIDQTVIAPGGVINYTGGTITLNDGAGDDLIIQGDAGIGVGGVFNHNGGSTMNVPVDATVRIQTAGILRVSSNAAGIGDAYAGNGSNLKFIYEDAAVFNWNTTLTFTSDNQVYFLDAGTATPIFLITANVGSIGANDPTTFNGLLLLDGGSISFQNAGLKTFRNGITGIGTVTQTAGATTGAFVVGAAGQTSTLGANIVLNGDANATLTQIGATVLSNDLTLSNGTLVVNGGINLNGRNINLGTTGRIQEDRGVNNFIITDLTAIDDDTQGGAINFEASITATTEEIYGTGLYLQRTAGADYTVTVARRHYQADGLGIKKVYDITGTATGTNTTMRITYAPSEVAGLAPEDLVIFRRKNNKWTRADEDESGFDNGTNGANYIEATSINEFSEWTAGDGDSPLPIGLLSFEALREGEQVRLAWRTASEQDNQGFALEMSQDGQTFETVTFIEGKGNSLELQSYEYAHTQPQAAYYRLKQLDIDGDVTYSEAVFVPDYAQRIRLYPNPVSGQVYLSGLDTSALTRFTLHDTQGKLILQTQSLEPEKILTQVLQGLSTGVYFLSVENAQKVQQLKVIID